MKHCILVKWNNNVIDKNVLVSDIRKIFDQLLVFSEVKSVNIFQNVIDRSNRYDLMVCVDMNKDFLPIYDVSKPHHEWKEKYGKFVEKKAIFDYEG